MAWAGKPGSSHMVGLIPQGTWRQCGGGRPGARLGNVCAPASAFEERGARAVLGAHSPGTWPPTARHEDGGGGGGDAPSPPPPATVAIVHIDGDASFSLRPAKKRFIRSSGANR